MQAVNTLTASSLFVSFLSFVNARNAQRAPFMCLVALASIIDKYLSMSFLLTFCAFSPFLAMGNNLVKTNSQAVIFLSLNQVNLESIPKRAAFPKLSLTSSQEICLVMSCTSCSIPTISPNQKAALANSSITVGPAGITRFSILRCGWPFGLIP